MINRTHWNSGLLQLKRLCLPVPKTTVWSLYRNFPKNIPPRLQQHIAFDLVELDEGKNAMGKEKNDKVSSEWKEWNRFWRYTSYTSFDRIVLQKRILHIPIMGRWCWCILKSAIWWLVKLLFLLDDKSTKSLHNTGEIVIRHIDARFRLFVENPWKGANDAK